MSNEFKSSTITTLSNDVAVPSSFCDARCLAERKMYVRDLQKWGRNVLLMIGLLFFQNFFKKRDKIDYVQLKYLPRL